MSLVRCAARRRVISQTGCVDEPAPNYYKARRATLPAPPRTKSTAKASAKKTAKREQKAGSQRQPHRPPPRSAAVGPSSPHSRFQASTPPRCEPEGAWRAEAAAPTIPSGDLLALAEHIYRQKRRLSVPRLLQENTARDGKDTREAALSLVMRAGWCADGPGLTLMLPEADYYTGDLWSRYDRAVQHPATHRPRSKRRAALLAHPGHPDYRRQMLRTHTALALACALAACNDDSPDPIAFNDLCGAQGPVRVLDLAPDQSAKSYTIADRIYYRISQVDADGVMTVPVNSWSSIGPCGESPRHIANGINSPIALDRWPGLVFGCISGTGLVNVDAAGVTPPHLMIPTTDAPCSLTWTDHGILAFAADDGASGTDGSLLLYPIPKDPRHDTPEPEVLIETVLHKGLNLGAEAVHFLTPDATLMRLGLADRSITSVQTNVRSYRLSADERYLLWQDSTITNGDPKNPTGIISLRDTASASATSVSLGGAQDYISYYSLDWIDRGYIRSSDGAGGRIYRLPGLDPLELPVGAHASDTGPLPDDRWVLESFVAPFLSVVDLDDGGLTPLFRDQGQVITADADNAIVLAVSSLPGANNGSSPSTTEGALWRVPLNGDPARHLTDGASLRATSRLDATRLLAGVDRTPDKRVTLLLVDLATDTAQPIAKDVTDWSTEPSGATTIVTYSVRDGQNSGLWRVRLPAP